GLQREITIRHGIEAVGGGAVKAKRRGRVETVGREAGARQRGRPQRRFVQALAGVSKTAAIAPDHLVIRHQVMAEGDGLGHLKVGEAGHYGFGMFLGAAHQRGLKRAKCRVGLVNGVTHPQLEVRRHLIVAGAGNVQPLGRLADQLGKARLHVHVDVLQRRVLHQLARLDLGGNLIETGLNGGVVLRREDALSGGHGGVRLRTGDVLTPQALVEADRCVNLCHHRGGSAAEPTTPQLIGRLVIRHLPHPDLQEPTQCTKPATHAAASYVMAPTALRCSPQVSWPCPQASTPPKPLKNLPLKSLPLKNLPLKDLLWPASPRMSWPGWTSPTQAPPPSPTRSGPKATKPQASPRPRAGLWCATCGQHGPRPP